MRSRTRVLKANDKKPTLTAANAIYKKSNSIMKDKLTMNFNSNMRGSPFFNKLVGMNNKI